MITLLISFVLSAFTASAQEYLSPDEYYDRLEDMRCRSIDDYIQARTEYHLLRARAYLALAEADEAYLALTEDGKELFAQYRERYAIPRQVVTRINKDLPIEWNYIAELRKLDRSIERLEHRVGRAQRLQAQLALAVKIRHTETEEAMYAAQAATVRLGNEVAYIETLLDDRISFDPDNPYPCSDE